MFLKNSLSIVLLLELCLMISGNAFPMPESMPGDQAVEPADPRCHSISFLLPLRTGRHRDAIQANFTKGRDRSAVGNSTWTVWVRALEPSEDSEAALTDFQMAKKLLQQTLPCNASGLLRSSLGVMQRSGGYFQRARHSGNFTMAIRITCTNCTALEFQPFNRTAEQCLGRGLDLGDLCHETHDNPSYDPIECKEAVERTEAPVRFGPNHSRSLYSWSVCQRVRSWLGTRDERICPDRLLILGEDRREGEHRPEAATGTIHAAGNREEDARPEGTTWTGQVGDSREEDARPEATRGGEKCGCELLSVSTPVDYHNSEQKFYFEDHGAYFSHYNLTFCVDEPCLPDPITGVSPCTSDDLKHLQGCCRGRSDTTIQERIVGPGGATMIYRYIYTECVKICDPCAAFGRGRLAN